MQGEGEYTVHDFIESMRPLRISYQSPRYKSNNMWIFCSEEDDLYPQDIISSTSSPIPIFDPYRKNINASYKQLEVKEHIKHWLYTIDASDISSSKKFLVQLWVPTTTNTTTGGRCVLKTSNQPFGLPRVESRLCKYRKHCISLEFSTSFQSDDEFDCGGQSVIGRVFRNKQMEYSPNVVYYSTKDYPHLHFALKCGICTSFALPLFQPGSYECVGVLEIVWQDREYFSSETYDCFLSILEFNYLRVVANPVGIQCLILHSALVTNPPFESQALEEGTGEETCKGMGEDTEKELYKALEVVCTTNLLPFAQIWIPYRPSTTNSENSFFTSHLFGMCNLQYLRPGEDMLHNSVFSFMNLCDSQFLGMGQGVVGRAHLSHNSCFCRDVSQLPIGDYPFSHYARECRFTGCFAISLHAKNHHDYVLEFFLPTSEYPRTLLESIFTTVNNHFQGSRFCLGGPLNESYIEVLNISMDDEHDSFKLSKSIGIQPVSEPSLMDEIEDVPNKVIGEAVIRNGDERDNDIDVELNKDAAPLIFEDIEKNVAEDIFVQVAETDTHIDINTMLPPMTKTLQNETELVQLSSDDDSATEAGGKNEVKTIASSKRTSSRGEALEGRVYRTTDVSLSREDLTKYFGMKLDDAAHSLGVSRSTLKRACRVHGIEKWPSPNRKKKIQPLPFNLNHKEVVSVPKRKKAKPSPSNLNHINQFVQGGGSQKIPKFSDDKPSDQPPIHATDVVPHLKPNVEEKQEESSMTVKATYGIKMIKFRLSFSSSLADLKEEVMKRLPLKEGSFYISYEDDDGDWVLIACDEDIGECIQIWKSKGKIRMLVQDAL